MKKLRASLIIIVALMMSIFVFGQIDPSSPEYNDLKSQGLIVQPAQVPVPSPAVAILPEETGARDNELFVLRDGTFTGPLAGNDDDSFGPFTLPFTFCFYGSNYTSFYINTNGNVSFSGPYGTYSATGFPIVGYDMLAPFWADVVTWDGTCGVEIGDLYYKIEATRVIVVWENVGYYYCGGEKRNTFELIFTDGNDPLIGTANNVAFSFGDMQWTTGDASSGSGGFGGVPATVGVNKGDGVKYALVGRFDHEGTDFDGAGGAADGVSYLDGRDYFFDACQEEVVIPDGVPVSNWALFIGIGLILAFAVIRFRRIA